MHSIHAWIFSIVGTAAKLAALCCVLCWDLGFILKLWVFLTNNISISLQYCVVGLSGAGFNDTCCCCQSCPSSCLFHQKGLSWLLLTCRIRLRFFFSFCVEICAIIYTSPPWSQIHPYFQMKSISLSIPCVCQTTQALSCKVPIFSWAFFHCSYEKQPWKYWRMAIRFSY